MTFMPPGECIDGTVAECAHLHLLLACFRASPPPMRLPEVSGRPLPGLAGFRPARVRFRAWFGRTLRRHHELKHPLP
jgi:hypothetical protein